MSRLVALPSNTHPVLVASGEERHLEQQTLAIVAQVVATLGRELWGQQVGTNADLPEVVRTLTVQVEADAGLRAGGDEGWRSCEENKNTMAAYCKH